MFHSYAHAALQRRLAGRGANTLLIATCMALVTCGVLLTHNVHQSVMQRGDLDLRQKNLIRHIPANRTDGRLTFETEAATPPSPQDNEAPRNAAGQDLCANGKPCGFADVASVAAVEVGKIVGKTPVASPFKLVGGGQVITHNQPLPLSIPHIIHQNYFGGLKELEQEALKPYSHFRKDWWLSCKTHHPDWEYRFWDMAAAEQLLTERYPWFLPTFKVYPSAVLKSDAIRPFILHAYGGVYLDLDTECYRPMDVSLDGYQVVLMSERDGLINNAQMASVPGHPLWPAFAERIQRASHGGKTWPLEATGPHVLTRAFRAWISKAEGDLQGIHRDQANTTIRVYGQGEWFTPCNWNDWECHVRVAKDRASFRRQFAVVGIHHFSGSWMGLDGSRSLSLLNEGLDGTLSFLADHERFTEHRCMDERRLGQPTDDVAYAVCWGPIQQDISDGRCIVYSVHEHPTDFAFENFIATAGCEVYLFTEMKEPKDVAGVTLHKRVHHQRVLVREVDDPFGVVPQLTLDSLMSQNKHDRLTILQIRCDGCEWSVMNQMYLRNSQLLARTEVVLLTLGPLLAASKHHAYALYQHLYQEHGYLGFSHEFLAAIPPAANPPPHSTPAAVSARRLRAHEGTPQETGAATPQQQAGIASTIAAALTTNLQAQLHGSAAYAQQQQQQPGSGTIAPMPPIPQTPPEPAPGGSIAPMPPIPQTPPELAAGGTMAPMPPIPQTPPGPVRPASVGGNGALTLQATGSAGDIIVSGQGVGKEMQSRHLIPTTADAEEEDEGDGDASQQVSASSSGPAEAAGPTDLVSGSATTRTGGAVSAASAGSGHRATVPAVGDAQSTGVVSSVGEEGSKAHTQAPGGSLGSQSQGVEGQGSRITGQSCGDGALAAWMPHHVRAIRVGLLRHPERFLQEEDGRRIDMLEWP